MKCKLDENIGDIGRALLEAAGHDVSTVVEQEMSGTSDVALFNACRSEGRLLVTLDTDFAELIRFNPAGTAGIAVLRTPGRQSPSVIQARIESLIRALKADDITGSLWIIEPGRVRIHERRRGGA